MASLETQPVSAPGKPHQGVDTAILVVQCNAWGIILMQYYAREQVGPIRPSRSPIDAASLFDKKGMNSRGSHDRSRRWEIKLGPDEIMEPPILIYDLVLSVSPASHKRWRDDGWHTWAGGTSTLTVSASWRYFIRSPVQLSNSPLTKSLKVSCTSLIFSGVAKGWEGRSVEFGLERYVEHWSRKEWRGLDALVAHSEIRSSQALFSSRSISLLSA